MTARIRAIPSYGRLVPARRIQEREDACASLPSHSLGRSALRILNLALHHGLRSTVTVCRHWPFGPSKLHADQYADACPYDKRHKTFSQSRHHSPSSIYPFIPAPFVTPYLNLLWTLYPPRLFAAVLGCRGSRLLLRWITVFFTLAFSASCSCQYTSAMMSASASAVRCNSSFVLSMPPISIRMLFGDKDWLYSRSLVR